ncbi:MAG: triose-phosphate isomerase [Thermoanaerobaculales bacterium]|nr:triose-phosphate isomerase [Thermoanaerobaculales bacterium]
MRRLLIAGNWKMHKGVAETTSFLESLLAEDLPPAVDVVCCPPFASLPAAAMMLAGAEVGLGAQNVHWEASGAFTGEVAAPMLAELGVGWVIVGHSERRTLFGETDATAVARARAAQAAGLEVIYCVGETLAERDQGATFAVLERQTSGLAELDPRRLALAYEPVWAIGTGRNASPEQAEEAHAFLRVRLAGAFGGGAAEGLRILYGGSLKPANARQLLALPDVDGGLIGGASLDLRSFSDIIRAAAARAAGVDS